MLILPRKSSNVIMIYLQSITSHSDLVLSLPWVMVVPYSDTSVHEKIHTVIDGVDDERYAAETNHNSAPFSDRGRELGGIGQRYSGHATNTVDGKPWNDD